MKEKTPGKYYFILNLPTLLHFWKNVLRWFFFVVCLSFPFNLSSLKICKFRSGIHAVKNVKIAPSYTVYLSCIKYVGMLFHAFFKRGNDCQSH